MCLQLEEQVGFADFQYFAEVIWFPSLPEFIGSVWMSIIIIVIIIVIIILLFCFLKTQHFAEIFSFIHICLTFSKCSL